MNKKLEKFIELNKDQFSYGGKKYKSPYGNKSREATDEIFDRWGMGFLGGVLNKYVYRYMNVKTEKDLLKIATYMYIIWLKRGFFVMDKGVSDAIDTNLENKKENFPKFVNDLKQYIEERKQEKGFFNTSDNLGAIDFILKTWSTSEWVDVKLVEIFNVFYLCFKEWAANFSHIAGQNTDTPLSRKDFKDIK